MLRAWYTAVALLGVGAANLARFGARLRSERAAAPFGLLSATVLVALYGAGATAYQALWRPGVPAAITVQQAGQYLLVCEECGYRETSATHPALRLPRESRSLKCPDCGAFAATSYRRGSQVLPPGGWPVP
jgi:hypothetical protein